MTGRSQMAADILQSQRREAGDRGKTTDGDRKIMRILLACMTGFGLDLIFGDPYWLYHPIRLIGHLISFLEKPLRSAAGKSPKKQIVAGGILWLLVILISTGIPCLMSVGGREDPPGCFVSSGMLLVLPDPGGTFTFCGE